MLNEGVTRPKESWKHRSIWSSRREVSELDAQREPRTRTPKPAAAGTVSVSEGGVSVTSREWRTLVWQTRQVCCLQQVTVTEDEGSSPSSGTSQGKATK